MAGTHEQVSPKAQLWVPIASVVCQASPFEYAPIGSVTLLGGVQVEYDRHLHVSEYKPAIL